MPVLDLFWAMLWFFLFIVWIWLLISIFADLFRSDSSGWAKAFWVIFVIVLPFLGVLVYLIVNGGKMRERSIESAQMAEQAQRDYIRSVTGSEPSTADELAKLADLKQQGHISDEEYERLKAKALG
jgi:uncharacterized SAM-binding protein YcdF (DUF218 family)